jgi:hypothetical protein
MTPTELAKRATALYGSRWQTALANRIEVAPRTVRHWANGDRPIPPWLGVMVELLERVDRYERGG